MKHYGLLGHPLSHSFSAGYFTDKFTREGIDATFENFDLPTIDLLPGLLNSMTDLVGFNVTIPYKQAVIPYLDALDSEAAAMGAVNVVRVTYQADGKRFLKGYNTDLIGFRESLRPLLVALRARLYATEGAKACAEEHAVAVTASKDAVQALVLGTGGASKAVCFGLKHLGVPYVLVSRTPAPGQLSYEALTAKDYLTHRLIVNTTPLGMSPKIDTCPPLDYDRLGEGHLLFDLVYNPAMTRFLQEGAARGALVKNGLEMLHLQAEAAWRVWNA